MIVLSDFEWTRRGLAAPLLFVALALAAEGSVVASPLLWGAALAVLIAASRLMPVAAPSGFTAIAATVMAFALWLVATNLWANPSYTAAAPYHAAFLFCGFLLGRRAGAEHAALLFGTALVFALGLAVWAIWQQIGQGAARGHALFETPATLASTINLLLAPGLVLLAWNRQRALLIVALVVLGAALAAAASRGGWLGLAAGVVIAFAFFRRAEVRLDAKSLAIIPAVLVIGWLASWLGALLGDWAGVAAAARALPHSMTGADAGQSFLERVALYQLALQGIASSPLPLGSGYLAFHYLLESARPAILGYDVTTTYFVHNDYLQTLLELGVAGLAGLFLMVALPIGQAWYAVPRVVSDARLKLIALAAAIGSMAVHALVDFPFYIPVCVLIYGTALGLVDSILLGSGCAKPWRLRPGLANMGVKRAVIAAAGTLAAWVLAVPAAAEAAADYGHRQWRAARGESAAYWLEVARRIEPRDWRYHWYAGQFWFAQAAGNTSAAAARLADAAFTAGDAANPREVRNLLGRITTHRRLRQSLAVPADAATMHDWADRAIRLAPREPVVLAEIAALRKEFARPLEGVPK